MSNWLLSEAQQDPNARNEGREERALVVGGRSVAVAFWGLHPWDKVMSRKAVPRNLGWRA